MLEIQVLTIGFDEIKKVWENFLWPERQSAIEPVSWISPQGLIDMEMKLGEPTFVGMFDFEKKLQGVVSGYSTSSDYYRSRGLWVSPDYRQKGVGRLLMSQLMTHARQEGHAYIWTMARHSSVGFYQKAGFETYKQTDQYEFGPHYLMEKRTESSSEK